jgi:hypothetical protein
MIKLVDRDKRVIADIAKNHFQQLEPILSRSIRKNLPPMQRTYILVRLEKILTSTPAELLKLVKNYKNFCKRNGLNENLRMTKAFSYENFLTRKTYNPYHLSKVLKVNVCPYCNRQYTFTISGKNNDITRPEFDHFFCQELYPMLALSFYNLVPSCTICNSRLKGRTKFKLTTHLHPYLHGFENDLRFNYTTTTTNGSIGLSDEINVTIDFLHTATNHSCIKGNCDVFQIEAIYREHKDVVREIVRKHYTTGGKYLQILAKSIPEMHTSDSELYQLAFGNFYDSIEFDKRPLGKLTKDIFNSLQFEFPK